MLQQLMLTKDEIDSWAGLVSRGIAGSLSGLSQMVGRELSVTAIDVKRFSSGNAAILLGKLDNHIVSSYLTISGDATVHLMLVHDLKIAFRLIDIQMDIFFGSTQVMGEAERSIMGEIGKVAGSFFLNALIDGANLTLRLSPPLVIVDTAKVIPGIISDRVMHDQGEVLIVKTVFSSVDRQIGGTFLVMPTLDFLKVIPEHSVITT